MLLSIFAPPFSIKAHRQRSMHARLRRRSILRIEALEDRITPAPPPGSPVVTGLSPPSGSAAGGTSVTISGQNLDTATAVYFGTNPGIDPSIVGDDILVTSPAGSGVVTVSVVNTVGPSTPNPPNDQFTYTTGPAVSGVAPNKGPLAGGTSVTITGINFVGASNVFFGATAANYMVTSNTSITAVSPASTTPGAVDVTVKVGTVTSPITPADVFTYLAAPVVSSVVPTHGPLAGGTPVTISGSGFTYATLVDFGTVAASPFNVVNDNSITVNSPPGLMAGTVDVTVTSPGGTSTTTPNDHFTYDSTPVAGPTVTSVSPAFGPTVGGTLVTVTGTNFVNVNAVDFGAAPGIDVMVMNDTLLTVLSPAGSGTVDVTVMTNTGTSPITRPADQFTYQSTPVSGPTVTGLNPASGPTVGGTLVTVTGTNFVNVSAVDFGTSPGTDVTVLSTTSLTVLSPAGSNTVDVTVTTNTGSSPINQPADQFTYTTSTDGPRVTSVVRYGYHAQPTYIVIYFNMALDPTSAQLVSNYAVETWAVVGVIGQNVPVKTAAYNAKTHAVTLSFSKRLVLRKTYLLTINGTTSSGVKNIAGALLDGAGTGQPGSNFVTTISQRNLAGSASQRPAPAALRTRDKSLALQASLAVRRRDV